MGQTQKYPTLKDELIGIIHGRGSARTDDHITANIMSSTSAPILIRIRIVPVKFTDQRLPVDYSAA